MAFLRKVRHFIGNIRRKYWAFRDWKRIVWDAKTDYSVPFKVKLKYALKGFNAKETVLFRLGENDYREYINEYDRLRAREINGAYKFILDNKIVFEEVFGKYIKVPENYAWISDGKVYSLHNNPISNNTFLDFLCAKEKAIMKWIDRGGGEGTYLLAKNGDDFFINGVKADSAEIMKLLDRKGEALLCEYITQSSFSASLFPHTANTIRIVCARKKGEADYKLYAAIQRIGCQESIPVDNCDSGGMSCQIDMETGRISYAMAQLGKKENRLKKFDFHPDTGMPISGKVIPNWEDIKNQVLELTRKVPYLNYVAWDVLLTEDGVCIIEGNASSGCALFQLEQGVKNQEMGDLYRSYGVIK